MRRLAVVVVVLGLLAMAASAAAQRRPTSEERAAIAKRFDVPAKCLRIRVSTVDERWARMNFKGRKFEDPDCAPHAADGIVVLRHKRGKWRFVTAGSSFDCPVPETPPEVAEDLRIPCDEQM